MGKFLLRKLVTQLVLVVIATSFAYMLAASTLNPRVNFANRQPPVSAEVIEATLNDTNLNDRTPVFERYVRWAGDVVQGDFGKTFMGGNVNDELGRRVGVSLRLMIIGTVLGATLGVLIGAFTAIKQYGIADRFFTGVAFVILSTPTFVMATLLILVTTMGNESWGLGIEFVGEYSPGLTGWDQFTNRINHLILPTITLAGIQIAVFSRYQRNMMLDVLSQDFIRTAMAKGLRKRTALYKHALRTALIPTATYFAFTVGLVFTGATFTESIFGWHGMGAWLIQSIQSQDVNAVAAVACFTGVCVLFAAFLSDVFVAILDPRVRVN
ncbi:ABC transporter permease [Nonomuraea sp. NPDC050310]|uniref:ABC transporter permease n=1 Tax=unclassified Nonomuraea TaxID=2593643 RepID=UPI0033C3ED12